MLPNLKCDNEDNVCFDEGMNAFISNSCENLFVVWKLLPAKPAKWFLNAC